MLAVPEQYRGLSSFAFGDTPELADELGALVVAGRKRATAMTPDNPNRPKLGERWIVVNGRQNPLCVIETIELAERKFSQVDEAFARDEGEGDGSLETWRRNHEWYFRRTGKFSPDMTLICERFRVVETF